MMLADNIPANTLSMEDIVTTGNQYIYLPYHYNKEVQEDGFVKVKYVKSVMNISDLTTKVVDRQTMKRLEPSATGYDLRLLNELMKLAYD